MTSKFRWVWLAGLSLAWLSLAEVSPLDFARVELGSPPAEQTLVLADEEQAAAASILGLRRFRSTVVYWQQGEKTVWGLEARGKVNLIGAGFVVEQGRMAKSQVLAFRETRGGQIRSERFLKQFRGLFLKKNGTLNRKINGYSGATYSVDAMRKMAQLALYFDSLVEAGGD